MPFQLADRVHETTTTTGIGSISLGGAANASKTTFIDAIGAGNVTCYCITDGNAFEVGFGTVNGGSPPTLMRDHVLASSNNGNLVNWPAGAKAVFCTAPAELLLQLARSGGRTVRPAYAAPGTIWSRSSDWQAYLFDGQQDRRLLQEGDSINGTTGTLSVERGGTGATSAGAALTNLGGTPTGRTITAGNGLSGGGNLAANRTIALGTPGTLTATTTNAATAESHTHNIDIATQAEAQAGTNTTKLMTPQRVAQAIGALAGGLGYGQTWQDVSSQRQVQTVYQNTTGKPIMVLFGTTGSGTQRMSVSHNNSTWVEMALAQNNDNGRYIYIIVPPGHYYRADNAGGFGRWLELR
ncbi:hypothetical protein [Telmatospirillum sp. J64-1]|uniref:hypothetical protein n=1 Tax=Telmatospirillum sp. J64-1 TaxID=2502183 RepID=UPI00115E40CB|nr:hypothetical protein [Telmatospirillum sp. J64-1]